jgi:protoheme IX farnesyltransferase
MSTIIGSVPGAIPMLAGYTAYTNTLDLAAGVLFFAMVAWQMPHFYAIAIRRGDEYEAAGLPVLPNVKGVFRAKLHVLFFIAAFVAISESLTFVSAAGYSYFIAMGIVGIWWLTIALQGFFSPQERVWAKKMFLFSLIVLLVFSGALSIASVLI